MDEAQDAIFRLRTAAPERPEPLLLQNLLAQRRKFLAPRWGQAFLQAWSEVGRPDLRDSPLLPPVLHPKVDATLLLSRAWLSASAESLPTLAMATSSLSEEQARWLLRSIPTLDDTARLVALLDPRRSSSFPDVLRSETQAALLQRLRWLSRDSSHAMLPRLTLLLSGTRGETPFNAQELKTLEAISMLPGWRGTSFSQTFHQARELLRQSGLPDTDSRAFGVAEQTVGSGVALLLHKRAEASWSHLPAEEQRWLGRMLWYIGQRMAEASSLLEHSVGTQLMELGAEHMEQMCDLEQARMRDDMVREGLRASLAANVEQWPLPSLLEDLESSRARNELVWLRAFTGHAELP
ncbi:hypothetical protein F0U59_37275 [Archangium gephyra]|nr:hypothetical protein F0U59_37275 [Archangium gephyra]